MQLDSWISSHKVFKVCNIRCFVVFVLYIEECGSSERESDVFVSYANGAGPVPLQQGEQW